MRWTGPSFFEVVLEDHGLRAVSRVHAVVSGRADLPTTFLEDLARNWRGWSGAKSWKSYEGDLRLNATADGKGHVFLQVQLAAGASNDLWRAEAMLVVEAGQLDEYVKGFHAFSNAEPRAA